MGPTSNAPRGMAGASTAAGEDFLKTAEVMGAIDNLPLCALVVNREGRFERLNPRFTQLTGYSPEELPDLESWAARCTLGDSKANWHHEVERALTGESIELPLIITVRNGGELNTLCQMSPLGDHRALISFADQSELRESRDMLRTVLDNVYDAVFIHDIEGKVIDLNQKLLEMYRVDRERGLGYTIKDYSSEDNPFHRLPGWWEEVLQGGTAFFEWRARRPLDGTTFDVEVFLCRITSHHKHYVLANVRDITQRKRDETERLGLERQLRQAQKMEAIGRLAGGVAHDFNNILTGIIGYAEVILHSLGKDAPLRKKVDEIRRAGERAAGLTAQLLAFSRQQLIAPQVININAVISSSQQMMERIIGEDIQLAFSPEEALWNTLADPVQIDQVLINLVVNARDAMPAGGRLSIETANVTFTDPPEPTAQERRIGDFVMMAVSDSGQGMDQETQQLIFEPFYSTKARNKGTGLGLATVYGVVKQNNGFITVYSEPDVGTTFKIYFPRCSGETAQLPPPELEPAQGGTETILVVEDDKTVRTMACTLLSQRGYRVLEANCGEHALAVADQHHGQLDLLLTDVIMPGINGRQLYQQLQERLPPLKVLYASGYTANVIARHGVLEEGVHFLSKPFNLEALLTKVREVLDGA